MNEKITAVATNTTPSRLGFGFMMGAILAVALFSAATKGVNWIIPDSWYGAYDSTDRPGERSGLRPHTDALTGCQYLSTSSGALTPRMDANGKQVCEVQP